MTGAPTTTDNRTLSVSDEDIRILCAVVFLCLPSPILMATLGARLKDTLNAYPQESSRTHLVSRIFGFGQPKPASKKLLSSWLRRFSNLFEIRPVSGQDERTVKMCGLAIMDEDYWRQDPSSPTKDRLFELPELSVRAKADGQVESIERDGLYFRVLLIHPAGVVQEHIIPIIFQLRIQEGAFVKKGEALITSMVILPRAASSDDSTEKFRQVSFDPKDNIKYPEAAVSREEDQDAEAEYPPATIPENRDEIITDEPRTIESPPIGPNLGKLLDGIFSTNPVNEDKEPQHDVSGKESAKQQPLEPAQENVERAKASVLEERQAAEQAKADAEKAKAAALEEQQAAEQAKADAEKAKAAALEEQQAAEQAKADAEKAKAARRQEAAQKAAAAIKAVTEELERKDKEKSEHQAKAEEPEAEKAALIDFWKDLNTAGWRYSLRDIVRFHTSVRTAALTILSGASGVGKSSLFKHYARFATACETDGELWKRMNVVSTWMEPSDMLGWRSPLASGVSGFQDAPGGLQAFLEGLQTKERSGKLSLLCFEEMNLAQAELYFSDFLQAVSDPSEDRKISNPRGGSFKIPNLRIVGTCNIDHTTKPFTERFLDRCNYIDLSAPDSESAVDQFFPAFCPDDNPSVPENGIPSFRQKTPSASGIKSVIDQKSQDDEDWAENWKQLAGVLKDLGVFPSRRVRVSMAEYILARPALLDLQETTLDDEKYYAEKEDNFLLGLDEALVQRVLPKLLLRGEWDKDDKFWKRVGLLKDLCDHKKLNLSLSYLFLGTHLEKGSMG